MIKILVLAFILTGCSATLPPRESATSVVSTQAKKTCVPYFGSTCFGSNNCFVDYRCE